MTLDLLNLVITTAEIEDGRSIEHIIARGGSAHLSGVKINNQNSRTSSRWTPEEDAYLKKNLGFLHEREIAKHLGRTVVSVHLRWKRDLHLTAPSKHPDFITGLQAAIMLGVDMHKISHWCDVGLIPYRNMAVDRKMRLIYRTTLFRWVTTPANWIYFNWNNIQDKHLRRLCALKAARWGDEWLSTPEVAKLHGSHLTSKDVQRLIYRKELPAVQVATSIGGRHKDPAWLNWYVLRSDAKRAKFYRGKGNRPGFTLTPRAAAWCKKAYYEMGLSIAAINRTMGSPATFETIKKAILRL